MILNPSTCGIHRWLNCMIFCEVKFITRIFCFVNVLPKFLRPRFVTASVISICCSAITYRIYNNFTQNMINSIANKRAQERANMHIVNLLCINFARAVAAFRFNEKNCPVLTLVAKFITTVLFTLKYV